MGFVLLLGGISLWGDGTAPTRAAAKQKNGVIKAPYDLPLLGKGKVLFQEGGNLPKPTVQEQEAVQKDMALMQSKDFFQREKAMYHLMTLARCADLLPFLWKIYTTKGLPAEIHARFTRVFREVYSQFYDFQFFHPPFSSQRHPPSLLFRESLLEVTKVVLLKGKSAHKTLQRYLVVGGKDGRFREEKLKTTLYNPIIVFSPDGRHWAYSAREANKEFIIYDGMEQKEYQKVDHPFFSPDSRHYAYLAREGNKEFVVYDGVAQKKYDRVSFYSPIVFSPDSRHWVYSAENNGKWFIVYDGVAQKRRYKPYGWGYSVFSPDSRHWAYRANSKGENFIVYDGLEQKDKYHDIRSPVFSPDSRHWAYRAFDEHYRALMVYDGVASKKKYPIVSPAVFSPDSRHWAYTAGNYERMFIVYDGVEQKKYAIHTLSNGIDAESNEVIFSPNSRHWAYTAGNLITAVFGKAEAFVVYDGVAQEKKYIGIIPPIVFSPDSRHWVYLTQGNIGKEVIVYDGVEQKKKYAFISPFLPPHQSYQSPIFYGPCVLFSPDSQHWVYEAVNNKKVFLVHDGQEQTPYDTIDSVVFSPDGRHWAYIGTLGAYGAIHKKGEIRKQFVVIDGRAYGPYQSATVAFTPDSRRVIVNTVELNPPVFFLKDEWGKIVQEISSGFRWIRQDLQIENYTPNH